MRWIFYFLLIINAVYFTWSLYLRDITHDAQENQQLTAEKSLELANPNKLSKPPIKKVDLEASHIAVEQKARFVDTGFATVDTSGTAKSIKNLSEQSTVSIEQKRCLDVGPYTNEISSLIDQYFISQDIEFITSEITNNEITGYLVYVDQDFSREQALAFVDTLKSQAIDSYVLTGEKFSNAVALGMYRIASNAKNRQKALINQGFKNVNIAPRIREVVRKQAKIVLYQDADLASLKQYLKAGNNKIKISENPCI